MQSASADFPIDGRAARMIRLPGWKPDVSGRGRGTRSGCPVTSTPASYRLRDPLEALLEQRLDVGEVARDALLREVEHDLLGPVDEIGGLARAGPGRAGRSPAPARTSPRSVAISLTIRA